MTISKSVELRVGSKRIPISELEELIAAGKELNATFVEIDQTNYNEPPYGSSTSTVLIVEQPRQVEQRWASL